MAYTLPLYLVMVCPWRWYSRI